MHRTLGIQKDEDTLLKKLRLGKVNVLKIKYSEYVPKRSERIQPLDTWDGAWARFRDLITELIRSTKDTLEDQSIVDRLAVSTNTMPISNKNDQIPLCLLHSVKKLIMDSVDLWIPAFLPALLPFMRSVHTLVLRP